MTIREDAVDGARKRVRTPILEAFSPEVVESMQRFIAEQVGSLIDRFADDGATDLMGAFARQLPVRIKAPVLGIDPGDLDAFGGGTFDFMELHSVAAQLPVTKQVENARRVVEYQLLLDAHAQRRRADPRDDLISKLVSAVALGTGPLDVGQRRALGAR